MSGALLIFILSALFGALLVSCYYEASGRGKSRDFNRINGKWRVMYDDHRTSQPMCRDVAEDYAKMFGGVVVPKDYEQ